MSKEGENIFKRKDGCWGTRYIKGYQLSGKRHGYIFKQSNAEEVYALAKSAVVLVPNSETTKLLVREAVSQLTAPHTLLKLTELR